MKIEWKSKGTKLEHGYLSVPISADIELEKFWNGRSAVPHVVIWNNRIIVRVKRPIKEMNEEKK